uniref:Uncharacterized protein n=1 Tax=Timema poppense TaxID=170557 RepID=A0A7R9CV05_TIMPO|nr:unnamed protein product [Timema poppensis]
MTAVHDILAIPSQSSKMQKSPRKKTQKYSIIGSPSSNSKNADATLKHFAEKFTKIMTPTPCRLGGEWTSVFVSAPVRPGEQTSMSGSGLAYPDSGSFCPGFM